MFSKNIYKHHVGLSETFRGRNAAEAIIHFRDVFFSIKHPSRTRKHVSDPVSGSACKRINMFLRWMVRKDDSGVDFGIWGPLHAPPKAESALSPSTKAQDGRGEGIKSGPNITSAQLMCPLDVHSGRVARKLGLLKRTQNDWKAVEELSANLRKFDTKDPVKYDFALFGLGVFEKF